ncbi:hypothetical protein LAZ67_1006119 [Cordylochernes scorpioides]|uniref:Gag-pol polyprotein n=1 Tax=Cordylochernes scorpioides TaxID=51811 RepID=A0ABY6JYR8_9ARAC|nr:hypothetical protein LAZ67_1006119 [Cordylochernes scorpioides]
MKAARVFLEMHQRDGDQLFSRIVTGDESWVHHSTPETKRQSMVWKKPEESAPKKAKVTISAGKVMAMENFKWEIFTHPPHSPELAPSDFHLYPALKWHLGGKHFANDDEVQAEANHWLLRQDTAWYNSEFKMKKNQKLRTLLRSSATESIREIDAEMEKESPSRETIRIYFKVLESNENKLRDVNSQIMTLMLEDETITPHDLEKEQDMVVQYEKNFIRTELRVAEYLQLEENEHQGRSNLDPTRSAQEGMSSYKLPKMALPVFDGTCLEWMGWWSRFEMIHESAVLSEMEKFQYLVQSMKVVKALQDRFGDKVILTEVYVRQLLKLVINNARKKTFTLEVHKVNAQIYGINDTKGEHVGQMVSYSVASLTESGWTIPIRALVVGRMTGILPSRDLRIPVPSSWKTLPLADPQFETSGRVDVILGADVYGSLLLPDVKYDEKIQLCAQKTRLGWIISGKLPGEGEFGPHRVYNIRVNYEENLDNVLRRFWEVEEVPLRPAKSHADEFCEELYKTQVQRTASGRYIFPLPFDTRVPVPELFGESVAICVRRQLALERRLARDAPLREEYCSFMKDYVELGHMTPLSESSAIDTEGYCFIPQHAVRGNQPDKSKLRVVFDASTKTSNGWSLNDRLYTGPKLQTDILIILMNWRRHKVVMLTVIEKMYRQIMVRPQDAKRQKIMWRESPDDGLKPYQLNTVTYGTSPAPFLALQTLLQLARDDERKYPRAAEVLRTDTYVDDILTGADNSVDALSLQKELIGLLKGGGFCLKKWASNDPVILNQIPEESHLKKIMFENAEVVKTLGLGWNPGEDCFIYDLQDHHTTERITKRQMLSFVARLYDHIGWLSPVVIIGKILIQQVWVTGVKWDESLDGSIGDSWRKFRDELKYLRTLRIPRWLGTGGNQELQLHGFSNASGDAYAAAIYLRVENKDGIRVGLLAAKTRLAPIHRISIPRLELCAAVLLTRLVVHVVSVLKLDIKEIVCWTDATINLSWIRMLSRTLPTFVGNRTAEIQACRHIKEWRHVPSVDNPADIASRGMMGSQAMAQNA